MIKKHFETANYITLYQIRSVKLLQMAEDDEMTEAFEEQLHMKVSWKLNKYINIIEDNNVGYFREH